MNRQKYYFLSLHNKKISRRGVAVLLMVVLITLGIYRNGLGQHDDDPYASFKENGVETDCVVPRLDASPAYGNADVDAGGGADLTDDEALAVYDCAKAEMAESYAKADIAAVRNYQNWASFSTVPYRSRAHSRRYVNNYANDIAAPAYGKYGSGGSLPEGSVIVKDSFVVTEEGRLVFGSLGIMEKMTKGFNPQGGDWRFVFVLPDGRLFGSTNELDEYTVDFCQECHLDAGVEQDMLFFLPTKYRK
jgi:hypothetical protein